MRKLLLSSSAAIIASAVNTFAGSELSDFPAIFGNDIRFAYPEWKYKALTFSYDDGVIEDRKLVEIFNRYGMKSTFNISAGRCGTNTLVKGRNYQHVDIGEIKKLYAGHEIASHGFKHLGMAKLSPSKQLSEIADDRLALETNSSKIVTGFAYPFGAWSEELISTLRKGSITYARMVESSENFAPPSDFMKWRPTAHHNVNLAALGNKYLKYSGWGGVLSICYIWGHSYEFEDQKNWNVIEDFCRQMSGDPDIWYATNGEIAEYLVALRLLRTSVNTSLVENTSSLDLYLMSGDKKIKLAPGESLNVRTGKITPSEKAALTPLKLPDNNATALVFPGGRRKALTFSFDDGSKKDGKLIEIFNKYGMKCTFNFNSGFMNDEINEDKYSFKELEKIYAGHEIATHGFRHATFRVVPLSKVTEEVFLDRLILESNTGRIIDGHAFPNGSPWSYDQEVENVLKACGIIYARGTDATMKFELPNNFWRWEPTTHQSNFAMVAKQFLRLKAEDAPKVCSVWGHCFEFRNAADWKRFDDICQTLGNKNDIWYATNGEIARYVQAAQKLQWSQDGTMVKNPTSTTIWYLMNGKLVTIPPGDRVTGLDGGGYREFIVMEPAKTCRVPDNHRDEDAIVELRACLLSAAGTEPNKFGSFASRR